MGRGPLGYIEATRVWGTALYSLKVVYSSLSLPLSPNSLLPSLGLNLGTLIIQRKLNIFISNYITINIAKAFL